MELTVLGCAGTFPAPDSGCSSYLVRHEGFSLVLDFGNGATGALTAAAGLLSPDAILLSHLHADHCVDLAAYSYARRFHPHQPPRLPVYGPSGTQSRLCQIFHKPPRDGLKQVYDFHTLRHGHGHKAQSLDLEIGPFRITLARTAHPIECYAIRVEADGKSLVYSADTGPSRHVKEVAAGADLFLCEATWLDGQDVPAGVHLRAREAGEHARDAEVERLVLVHQMSYLDHARTLEQAAEAFTGPLELAEAGKSYAL